MGDVYINIMDKIEVFFMLLCLSGMMIVTYKDYALKRGWSVGAYYRSDSSFLRILGSIVLLGGFVISFFYVKWYIVLFGLFLIWLLGGFVTALFKEKTQIISIVVFFVSFIVFFF